MISMWLKSKRKSHGLEAGLLLGVLIAAVAALPAKEKASVSLSAIKIKTESYTSSQVCANCHKDIHADWRDSMHAQSLEDPIFKGALLQAQVKEGEKVGEYCLFCHAPTVQVTKDYFLRDSLTHEGVTCDFCHTITAARPGDRVKPYDFQPGLVKHGPFGGIVSPVHQTKMSDLHLHSEFCGGCHELINSNGVEVMGTYTEWKEGPYPAEGIHCQNCHMPMAWDKKVVDPSIMASNKLVTAHEFRGGHSQINLRHAAKVELEVHREGELVKVTTYVTNAESGHKLPTGTPARKVVLLVTAKDDAGNVLGETRRVYRKVLVDKDGVVLEDNVNLILHSVRVYSDNRIAPRERRKEEFMLYVPPNLKNVNVEAKLNYEFETPVMYTQKMEVEMAREIQSLKVR